MKRYVIFLGLIFLSFNVDAQDIIVFRNAEEVQAKVLEIYPNQIRYVNWKAQDGPVYVVDKKEVFVIKYQNGEKEMFENLAKNAPVNSGYKGAGKYIHRIKPQGYFYVGLPFNDIDVGPAVSLNFGGRFFDYFFLGLEFEYDCIFEKTNYSYAKCFFHNLSVGLDMRGYVPVSEKTYPFLNLRIGTGIWPLDGRIYMLHAGMARTGTIAWFDMQLGAGIDIGRFSIGMGYHMMKKYNIYSNLGYFKVGLRL